MGDHAENVATEFVRRFHALEGDTISDRKKNFNKLIKEATFEKNKKLVHDALDSLEPKTYMESLFKVDALIHFKHTDRMYDVLQGGNEVYISKILKQHWFFKERFENMDAESLVNDFLPCLSFTIRMKVLNRLSKVLNENKMDQIFDCLHKRYGLWIATKTLHACSEEKIQTVLSSEQLTLQPCQVMHLFNRNESLLEIYLDYYKESQDVGYSESKITNYIAWKNPEFFHKMEKKGYLLVMHIGKRASKRVFLPAKNDIKENYEKYERLFNKTVLIRKMGNDFKDVYLSKFPKKISDFGWYSPCRTILNYCPRSKRWSLFEEAFLEKHPKEDLSKVFIEMGKHFLTLYPKDDIVVKWAEQNYKDSNSERFLKYLPTTKAIPLLKQKINLKSDHNTRGELVKMLLQNCKKQNDLIALEEVLKYVCTRHKNEKTEFRENFLNKFMKKFKLNILNETHWGYILEQIKLLEIQKVFFPNMLTLLYYHLEFLFKHDKEFEEPLINYISKALQENQSLRIDLKNPEGERKILIEILKTFPNIVAQLSQKKLKESHFVLIEDIINFCESYPDHFIDLGEQDYIETFLNTECTNVTEDDSRSIRVIGKLFLYKERFPQTTILQSNQQNIDLIVKIWDVDKHNNIHSPVKKFILKKIRTPFENLLVETYFNILSHKSNNGEIVNWFLRNEPKVVDPHFERLCEKDFTLDVKLIKLLSHFHFDDKFKSSLDKKLQSNESNEFDIIDNLRVLLRTNEFAKFINNKYLPKKTKLDLEDEEMTKVYDLQCRIAKILHKVEEPSTILPTVLKFSVGDYLQSALPSLQGTFYKTAEKELYAYVKELSRKAVSVRKHSVFLSCDLLPLEYVTSIFITSEEKNVSNLKYLFKAAFKFFKKNPSKQLFDIVVDIMSTIDKNDTETLETLTEITEPRSYMSSFIEKSWDVFESLKNEDVNVDDFMKKILSNLNERKNTPILVKLSSAFVKKLINDYYFESLNSYVLGKCLIKYFNHKGNLSEELLTALFNKLSKVGSKNVKEFLDSFRCLSDNTSVEFITAFSQSWYNLFKREDTFEGSVWIDLFLLGATNSTNEDLARSIIEYHDRIIEEVGPGIIMLFRTVFKEYVDMRQTEEQYELFKCMLNVRTDSNTCITVLNALEPIYSEELDIFASFKEILNEIGAVEDLIVKICYKKYLNDNGLE